MIIKIIKPFRVDLVTITPFCTYSQCIFKQTLSFYRVTHNGARTDSEFRWGPGDDNKRAAVASFTDEQHSAHDPRAQWTTDCCACSAFQRTSDTGQIMINSYDISNECMHLIHLSLINRCLAVRNNNVMKITITIFFYIIG